MIDKTFWLLFTIEKVFILTLGIQHTVYNMHTVNIPPTLGPPTLNKPQGQVLKQYNEIWSHAHTFQ